MKTIGDVSKATGISRFTLSGAARRGLLKKACTLLYGNLYIIDVDHEDFKAWQAQHAPRPDVQTINKTRKKAKQ